jgi:predicted phosphodiesterase
MGILRFLSERSAELFIVAGNPDSESKEDQECTSRTRGRNFQVFKRFLF